MTREPELSAGLGQPGGPSAAAPAPPHVRRASEDDVPTGPDDHLPSRGAHAARRIAPEIFRKRLLIEGYFAREDVTGDTLLEYFALVTSRLGLRTYADPIVHRTSGEGKAVNEGYDAFVPLIDSGIYVCVWSGPRFGSVILYTCAEFDVAQAVEFTREFFRLSEYDSFEF